MTPNAMLAEQLREVATRRQSRDEAQARVKALRAQFEADIEPLVEAAQVAAQACAESEEAARALTVALYEATGNKAPAEGAAIRLTTKLAYDDADALAWAKQTGMALIPESVDRKALEKIAKASPLPFVTVTQEPSATLASDLTAYLTPTREEAPF